MHELFKSKAGIIISGIAINILELLIVLQVGLLLNISIQLMVFNCLLCFTLSRILTKRFNDKKDHKYIMHYRSSYLCFVFTILIFVTMILWLKFNVLQASLFSIFAGIVLTKKADCLDMFGMWNPKNEVENKSYNDLIVKRIKELCEEKNISYYKLAKNSKVPKSTLNDYLNRTNSSASPLIIKKICHALELKEHEFYNHDYFNDYNET